MGHFDRQDMRPIWLYRGHVKLRDACHSPCPVIQEVSLWSWNAQARRWLKAGVMSSEKIDPHLGTIMNLLAQNPHHKWFWTKYPRHIRLEMLIRLHADQKPVRMAAVYCPIFGCSYVDLCCCCVFSVPMTNEPCVSIIGRIPERESTSYA
jgi:hypothetical protein